VLARERLRERRRAVARTVVHEQEPIRQARLRVDRAEQRREMGFLVQERDDGNEARHRPLSIALTASASAPRVGDASPSMGIALNNEIRRLLDGRNFAVLATINPDGGPQSSVIWVARDGDDVLFSTVAGRRKHRNLERDPRASLTVIDSEDQYNYVELRGRITRMDEDVGRAFDTSLSWKYDDRDPDPDRPGAVRLILRLTAEKATGSAA
jgi:PPOX class probable F420-dependent enzyme